MESTLIEVVFTHYLFELIIKFLFFKNNSSIIICIFVKISRKESAEPSDQPCLVLPEVVASPLLSNKTSIAF